MFRPNVMLLGEIEPPDDKTFTSTPRNLIDQARSLG